MIKEANTSSGAFQSGEDGAREEQPLTSLSWPGSHSWALVFLPLKINDFAQNQHQTRPLCAHDGTQQRRGHLVILSEHKARTLAKTENTKKPR